MGLISSNCLLLSPDKEWGHKRTYYSGRRQEDQPSAAHQASVYQTCQEETCKHHKVTNQVIQNLQNLALLVLTWPCTLRNFSSWRYVSGSSSVLTFFIQARGTMKNFFLFPRSKPSSRQERPGTPSSPSPYSPPEKKTITKEPIKILSTVHSVSWIARCWNVSTSCGWCLSECTRTFFQSHELRAAFFAWRAHILS